MFVHIYYSATCLWNLKDLLQQSDFNGWHATNRYLIAYFLVWYFLLLFAHTYRWSDPDNKSVTAKVI